MKSILSLFLLCIPLFTSGYAYSQNDQSNILVISSYADDSKRVTNFTDDLLLSLNKNKYDLTVAIENMRLTSLDKSNMWKDVMNSILSKYQSKSVDAIILLGQEAWATYLGIDKKPDIPFFACYVSKNGIILPTDVKSYEMGQLSYINTIEYAQRFGCMGGIFNQYDITKNINLIRLIYPSTDTIAFLTDNTYGGLSLLLLTRDVIQKEFPDIKFVELDGSRMTPKQIEDKINGLSTNSALLLGTWRIDNNGTFFVQSSVKSILGENEHLPVFTVSGLGLGDIAIGGYIPEYTTKLDVIVDNILTCLDDKDIPTDQRYIITKNKYVFDENLMRKYGIKEHQLPANSLIDNPLQNQQLKQYKRYILYYSIILIILAIIFIAYIRVNKKYKKTNIYLKRNQVILHQQTQELMQAKEEAEKSDRLKSAFLANMSHEIRTPLNSIIGFSEILKDAETKEEKDSYWEIIRTNNDLLLRLIEDILDLSKIEAGMIELKFTEVDISKLFNDIYITFQQRYANRSDIEFLCENPYNSLIIDTDSKRINQIITNFITNAYKFTTKGHIKIGYALENGGIKFYCEDTGIGIKQESIKRVFERFQKLDDFAQGTGLGMAICKAILDEYKGKIGVESKENIGSYFWAWIPVEIKHMSDLQENKKISESSNQQAETNDKHDVNKIKILIAEDNDSNYLLLSHILKNQSLTRVINGAEAVSYVYKYDFDLILMDIKMPIMDGLEATRAIREFNKEIKIIAITANAFDSDRKNAIAAGCNDFITKPVKRDVIDKIIDDIKI